MPSGQPLLAQPFRNVGTCQLLLQLPLLSAYMHSAVKAHVNAVLMTA